VSVSAVTSWLDRWAERTLAKDRETIAHQREVDELRPRVPREPVVGPSGISVTIRVERNGMPVGEGLDPRGDNRRLFGMLFNSGNNPHRYDGYSVYAFTDGQRPRRWGYSTELLAWRAAVSLVEDVKSGGVVHG
jgi:hypothetical protein